MPHAYGWTRPVCRPASLFAWVITLQLLPSGAAVAQNLFVGSEFHVNTYTDGGQGAPAVASEADGDFIVVWADGSQDGYNSGVFARRFSRTGAAQATEFQVNAFTNADQSEASVAVSSSGDFVVVWQSYHDGSETGIFARRFSSAGVALASEFQVNIQTAGAQSFPSVAASGAGDFVVTWESFDQDGGEFGIFAHRYSSAGVAVATEFQVNVYTTYRQRFPSVAADAGGNFVIAWESDKQDGDAYGIFARRFSSSGVALAGEFQVNAYTAHLQYHVAVAKQATGDFAIAWTSFGQSSLYGDIFARRFLVTGVPSTGELQVTSYTASSKNNASVALYGAGEFVVTWQSDGGQDGSSDGVFAQRFSSTGAALSSEFQVNTYTPEGQNQPSVAAAAGGTFVIAWHSAGPDDESGGVLAQRFAVPKILDIDGNGSITALTDGLLVVRFLFGFTGTSLTNGIVGASCTRCDAAAIQPYLQTLI